MWLAYRQVIAVVYVLLFFAAAGDFLFGSGMIGVPPLFTIAALGVMAVPLAFTGRTLQRVMDSPVAWWCGLYVAFTLLAFMWSSQSAAAWGEVRLRLLASFFLLSVLVVFADPRSHGVVRGAVLCSVILAVLLNVVDLVRPLTFSPIPGRAAGLYVNPNTSAIALVLGMVLCVGMVRQAVRPWFMCFVGAGVLMTFSRGGALVWVAATLGVMAMGIVRPGRFVWVAASTAVVVLGGLLVTGWWGPAIQMVSVVSSDAWTSLRVGSGISDASSGVRLGAAKLAWQMFAERPFGGWGVGATTEWDWSESTHNIYLRHLAEYGIAGLTIMPLLFVAMARSSLRVAPKDVVLLIGVVFAWGIFSHNVLDERHVLIAVALVSMQHVAVRARNRAARPIDDPVGAPHT